MIQVHDNIFVGQVGELLKLDKKEWSVLGVTNSYHYIMHNWVRGGKYSDNPCYVIHEEEGLMSINWVDAEARFFDYQRKGVKNFIRVLDFIEKQQKPVFIFCDQGYSRSPSVALLYLAKRLKMLPDNSFIAARRAFEKIYPDYSPSGIADFLCEHWEEIK